MAETSRESRRHESGEQLAAIKELNKSGQQTGRPDKISINGGSLSAIKPASPFIVRLQKQSLGNMPTKDGPPQAEMAASKTSYGKPFTR